MKKIIKILPILIFCLATSVKAAYALPHFTISPATGSYTKDSNVEVKFGAVSDAKKISGMDAMIEYDATKFDMVGDAALSVGVSFQIITNKISAGKVLVSLIKNTTESDLEATALNGEIFKITFKAKATGMAKVNFSKCIQDSMGDSNMLTREGGSVLDVISCTDNDAQKGEYTINAVSGGDTPTNTPAPSSGTSATSTPVQTAVKTELPKTGNTAVTVGLFLLTGIGLIGGFLLKSI